jgi:hypothetical protein
MPAKINIQFCRLILNLKIRFPINQKGGHGIKITDMLFYNPNKFIIVRKIVSGWETAAGGMTI